STPAQQPAGALVVDKPAAWTSHDVVARIRKLAQTRKVGHGGTLDPMATGVLVVGINRATRLLGYLQSSDKEYTSTIRLGQATISDDSTGAVLRTGDTSGISDWQIDEAIGAWCGQIQQVPSGISAVKVDGRRAYQRVRSGEKVQLEPRSVTVSTFDRIRTA